MCNTEKRGSGLGTRLAQTDRLDRQTNILGQSLSEPTAPVILEGEGKVLQVATERLLKTQTDIRELKIRGHRCL